MNWKGALGYHKIRLRIKDIHTIDSFFNRIAVVNFGQSGSPELVSYGGKRIIVFPMIDRNNQVWITKGRYGGFTVQYSSHAVDIGETALWEQNGADRSNPRDRCIADCKRIAEAIECIFA